MIIVQTGDNHLDYRQYNLEQRRKDFDKAFLYVVNKAIELQADVFLITGDIFESAEGDSSKRVLVQQAVQRLKDNGITVLGIRGNHDCSPGTLRLCGVHPLGDANAVDIFGNALPGGPISVTSKDNVTVNFAGMDYEKKATFNKAFDLFVDSVPEDTHVIAMHQTLAQVSGLFSECSGEELAARLAPKGVKYIALGHIHGAKEYDIDGVHMSYAGSTEMTDISDDPIKSFDVITFTDGNTFTKRREVIPTREIKEVVLTTVEQTKELLLTLDSETALVVVEFDVELTDHVKLLKDRATECSVPMRVTPFYADAALEGERIHVKWDREKQSLNTGLKDLVHKSFSPDTPEYNLVLSIINNMDAAHSICAAYKEEKLNDTTV